MGLVGKDVEHSKYGEGIIIFQDVSSVSVKFTKEDSVKKFIYPTCFKTFLKLLDTDIAIETSEKIKQHEEAEIVKIEQARREMESQAFTRRIQAQNNKSSKTVDVRPFSSVTSFCDEYKRALSAEIAHLKSSGGKRQQVFDGKQVERKSGWFVYTFEADDELNYPEGTQISIWQDQTSMPGSILGCEDFTVIIGTSVNLGAEISVLEFSAEPWRLISSLMDRLDELSALPSEIVKTLICDSFKAVDYSNTTIIVGQQAAVRMSQSQPITFVWGPPGTGKTQTLAQIALSHIAKGHRVLMLSYSNVSVDGATMRVHLLGKTDKPGLLVRYGYARRKELLGHEYLTSYNLAIHKHPDLMLERKNLIAERKKVSRNTARYVQIGRRLTEIRNRLSEEEKHSVNDAMFVATTVSKAVVDNTVRNSDFDVVIFDEASMAYIPQIIFSASLAKSHFVCMGDFRQLPPIVQSSSNSPLNADIFQYCGITSAIDSTHNHKWLCMLDTQHRMHPHIADFASMTMYGCQLMSAENMARERQDIVKLEPAAECAIGFADLSGMMSVCTKTANSSRINVLSALLSFSLALRTAKTHEVGIITPYNAQSRLLHAMARDVSEMNPDLKPISCATVHQFQGSEKDVIIYDTVDCYRMPYPGMLLTATGNNYANRLFNVAVTRAKGKFVCVSNISYMDNKNLSKGLMFKQMIEQQKGRSGYLGGGQTITKQRFISGSSMSFYDVDEGYERFLQDLAEAKQDILIDIPDKPQNNAFLTQLANALHCAKNSGIKVHIRAESKKNLPNTLRALAIENAYVANPVALIDKKIIWFGMPMSEAQFVSEGIMLPIRFRPIIRYVGQHTAKSLYGYMEMSRTTDQSTKVDVNEDGKPITDTFASYVLANKICPSCGKPMRLQKSKRGKLFISCTGYPSCQETAFADVDFIEKYFYRHGSTGQHCTKCNCSLEAKLGQYGLYIQCCGAARHKYKLDEI